jgi:hypothetical protein
MLSERSICVTPLHINPKTFRILRNRHTYFARIGLPTPPPSFFDGNLFELITGQQASPSLVLREWTKKYGKTYGYYEGPRPVIVTSDINIINDVFVKQFNNFHGRKVGCMMK